MANDAPIARARPRPSSAPNHKALDGAGIVLRQLSRQMAKRAPIAAAGDRPHQPGTRASEQPMLDSSSRTGLSARRLASRTAGSARLTAPGCAGTTAVYPAVSGARSSAPMFAAERTVGSRSNLLTAGQSASAGTITSNSTRWASCPLDRNTALTCASSRSCSPDDRHIIVSCHPRSPINSRMLNLFGYFPLSLPPNWSCCRRVRFPK